MLGVTACVLKYFRFRALTFIVWSPKIARRPIGQSTSSYVEKLWGQKTQISRICAPGTEHILVVQFCWQFVFLPIERAYPPISHSQSGLLCLKNTLQSSNTNPLTKKQSSGRRVWYSENSESKRSICFSMLNVPKHYERCLTNVSLRCLFHMQLGTWTKGSPLYITSFTTLTPLGICPHLMSVWGGSALIHIRYGWPFSHFLWAELLEWV